MNAARATEATPPRWDLSWIADSLDSPSFTEREEAVGAQVARLQAHFDNNDIRAGDPLGNTEATAEVLAETIDLLNSLITEVREIRAAVAGMVSQDATDDLAATVGDRLRRTLTTPLNILATRFDAFTARVDPEELALLHPTIADHLYPLKRSATSAHHQMSEAEESLAAGLALTGGTAWVRLHGDIYGRLTGTLEASSRAGETLPVTQLRALATDPDSEIRRAAFEAELDAWKSNSISFAAALNSQKGESITLNRRRGWPDDLAPALFDNAIDATTLEAMTAEVTESLSDFRRYISTKARVLGHGDGRLPWWDLLAPAEGAGSGETTWTEAINRVRTAFGTYAMPLEQLATRAAEESWIDAEPRAGKAGGAFCMPVRGADSRILLTFDGSADAVQTLAHELGHAYHNSVLGDRTWMQRSTPRCLAETASIFCETLVVQSLITAAQGPERLALLETDLQGATQVVVDIHSRFLFETELYNRRAHDTLSVDEFCELMTQCQRSAYGEVVEPLHPWMWAVKAHYFTPYYNFPYTFGLLFGLGLYARYQLDPEGFRHGYDDLLGATGLGDAAALASRFDIDITDRSFWKSSLDVLRSRIDDYCDLVTP